MSRSTSLLAFLAFLLTRTLHICSAVECPTNCSCVFDSSQNALQIVCPQRGQGGALVESLPREIDDVLGVMADRRLEVLIIQNTSLTAVPEGVT